MSVTRLLLPVAILALLPPPLVAAQTDLDAFMKQVVARRDDNWRKLQQYILDERQSVDLYGPGRVRVWSERRDYTWFIQDGYFVRSPLAVNGVTVGEDERRRVEAQYLRRVKRRDGAAPDGGGAADADAPPTDVNALIQETREPEFISSSYFLEFTFDEGRYALVGRETMDGHPVLRIEYYPTKLFSDRPSDRGGSRRRGKRDEAFDAQLQQLMNKVSLVTLWIDPGTHQIVKYTFDNVGLDFLPGAWLVQVDDVRASMEMKEAFPEVWLPASIDMNVGLQLAIGTFDVAYRVDYRNYRRAETAGRLIQPAR
jgi:hypothetical protein